VESPKKSVAPKKAATPKQAATPKKTESPKKAESHKRAESPKKVATPKKAESPKKKANSPKVKNVNKSNMFLSQPTKYKGVFKQGSKYVARVKMVGKIVDVGVFDKAKTAAEAYDKEIQGKKGFNSSHMNFGKGKQGKK